MPTQDELEAELEKLGEDKVRAQLATSVYGDAGNKRALVVEWLRKKDQSRSERREKRRNIRDTIAAIAAIVAAVAATIAAVASIILLFSI